MENRIEVLRDALPVFEKDLPRLMALKIEFSLD